MASNHHNHPYIPTTTTPLSSAAPPFQPSFPGGTTRRPEAFTTATSRLDFSTPYIPFTQPLPEPLYTHQTGSATVTAAPAFAPTAPYGYVAQHPYSHTMAWPYHNYSAPSNPNQFYTSPPIPPTHTYHSAPPSQPDPVTLIAQLVGQMMQPPPMPPPPPPLPPMLANLMAVLNGEQPNKHHKPRDVAQQFTPSIANQPMPMSTTFP